MNRRQNGHLILSLSLAVSVLAVLLLLVAGQTVLAGEPIAADPIGLPIPARPLAQIQDPAVLSATPITGTVVPGAALPYMVTVVNTCTVPTTVTLACAHSRPADFTGSFVTETFTNVPAGQSVTTTLGVTPNLGTLAYIANVTAITATLDCTTTEYVAYVTTTVARQYGVELTALEPSARSTPPLVPVTFTLVITNAGNYTDTMTLTCTSVPSFTCELTPGLTLGPNVSGTACLTVTPDTGTPAGTPAVITTTAMAGDNNTTAQDVVTVTVSPIYGVDQAVTPTAAQVPAGGKQTYTVTVTNTGNTTDTFNLAYTDVYTGDNFSVVHPTTAITLPQSGTGTAFITVTAKAAAPAGARETTVVTATSQNDRTRSSTDIVTTTVSAPVLTITKTDSPDPVAAGGILTYTLTVTNTGNADATGVTITDVVPANTTFFTATVGGGLVGNQVLWTGQTVNAGGSLIVRFSVSVSDVASGTQITNQVYGVTCAQGVYKAGTPVDTRVEVITHTLCLPLVLKAYRAPSTAWSQGEGLKNVTVYGICVGKKSEKILYAGTDRHGIYRSTDGGNQWFPRGSVSSLVYAIAMDPTNDQIVYAVTWGDGVLKTENGGDSWNKQNNGLEGNLWLDALAVYTGTIYVGTGDAGVYKSTNGGASWQSINSGLTNRNIRALAVDPTNSEVVYAGTTAGVYKTTNGGSSWAKTSLGDFTIWRIAVSPSNSQVVYAGTEGHGMYKTTDGGTQWSAVNNGLPESGSVTIYGLAIDSSNPNIVYAGTKGHGVYETTNGGDSWAAMNQGWEDTTIVEDLALDSADPPTLHAATKGGVYWWFWP